MVPDRQKVWTDGRTDGRNGLTDDAKTISLRLCRGIIIKEGHIRIIPAKFGQNPTSSLGDANFCRCALFMTWFSSLD